jgi:hypothetical protein
VSLTVWAPPISSSSIHSLAESFRNRFGINQIDWTSIKSIRNQLDINHINSIYFRVNSSECIRSLHSYKFTTSVPDFTTWVRIAPLWSLILQLWSKSHHYDPWFHDSGSTPTQYVARWWCIATHLLPDIDAHLVFGCDDGLLEQWSSFGVWLWRWVATSVEHIRASASTCSGSRTKVHLALCGGTAGAPVTYMSRPPPTTQPSMWQICNTVSHSATLTTTAVCDSQRSCYTDVTPTTEHPA